MIFISYSVKNRDLVRKLAHDIELLGHTVWFNNEFIGDSSLWGAVLQAIQHADIFVFALSPDSLASPICIQEYMYAHELKKPILPILVTGDVSTNILPPELTAIPFVDYRMSGKHAWQSLGRAFGALSNLPTSPNEMKDTQEKVASLIDKTVILFSEDTQSLPAKVFISYSSENRQFTRKIYSALIAQKIDMWLDVEEIKHGDDWADKIQQGLDECIAMILIISPESMASRHVSDEWKYYLNGKPPKPVLPVIFKEAKIHFQLNTLQYVNFTDASQFNDSLDKLVFSAKQILEGFNK